MYGSEVDCVSCGCVKYIEKQNMCKMEGIVIHAMYQKLGGEFSLRMPWLSGQIYTFEMGR